MACVDWKKYKYSEPKHELRHNDKEMRLKDNHSNPDIKKSQTNLNLELYGGDYQQKCDTLDRLVTEAKSNMKRVRCDAVTMIGLNIKLPPDLSGEGFPYSIQKRWCERCFEVVCDFLEADDTERIVSATADFDELHWYTDTKTHERVYSRPELDVRFVPILDGKLNAKKFETIPRIRALNNAIEQMTEREFGCVFMTGKEAGLESIESLKAQSRILEAEQKEAELVKREAEIDSKSGDLTRNIKHYNDTVKKWNDEAETRNKILENIAEWENPENVTARNKVLAEIEAWDEGTDERLRERSKLDEEIKNKRRFAGELDEHSNLAGTVEAERQRGRDASDLDSVLPS